MDNGNLAWAIFLFVIMSLGLLMNIAKGLSGSANGGTFLAFLLNALAVYAVLQVTGWV